MPHPSCFWVLTTAVPPASVAHIASTVATNASSSTSREAARRSGSGCGCAGSSAGSRPARSASAPSDGRSSSATTRGRPTGCATRCNRSGWRSSGPPVPGWRRSPGCKPARRRSSASSAACFRKTTRLLLVWPVDKSKGAKTESCAFDKPQLRRRRPVREKPPSPAHDEGLD